MARDGAMLTTLVHEEFDKIGQMGRSAFPLEQVKASCPKSVNNKERWLEERRTAWNFWVASRVRSRANKSYDMAKDLCESMGLFAKLPLVAVGSMGTIWQSELVTLTVRVNNPQEKLDPVVLCNELRKMGVDERVLAKAVRTATTKLKPAVVHEPTLSF